MKSISALIICFNEEKNIEECIQSVLWCDEIIIIDGFSTDATVSIAEKYPVKVFLNQWKGYAEQRKFGLSKAGSNWIFSLDADERCPKELSDEIKNYFNGKMTGDEDFSGFEIPRKSFFLGRWIKHCGWYPDYQLRLFKKDSVSVKERLVHEGYEVSGAKGKMKNYILHYTVNSISEFANKINHYSDLSAKEKANSTEIKISNLFIRPFFEFKKKYIFQLGFLDGIQGLMVSFFHMITKILTYMKIWEMQNRKSK